MQVEIGSTTIENHFQNFLLTSKVSSQVRESAQGGVRFLRNTWHKISGQQTSNLTAPASQLPGQRFKGQWERSQDFLKKSKDKAVETIN